MREIIAGRLAHVPICVSIRRTSAVLRLSLRGLGRITFLTFVLQLEPRRDLIEYAVDEAARFLVAIGLGQLDRLINRYARGNVFHPLQFENREPQNIMIDAR